MALLKKRKEKEMNCEICEDTGIITVNMREMETGRDYQIEHACFNCEKGDEKREEMRMLEPVDNEVR